MLKLKYRAILYNRLDVGTSANLPVSVQAHVALMSIPAAQMMCTSAVNKERSGITCSVRTTFEIMHKTSLFLKKSLTTAICTG